MCKIVENAYIENEISGSNYTKGADFEYELRVTFWNLTHLVTFYFTRYELREI